MGDFEVCLAGRERNEPFRLAEADADRTVGIQVQYRIIRQATTQLFAVTCLKVQCRSGAGGRYVRNGPDVPQREQAKTQHSDRSHRRCGC